MGAAVKMASLAFKLFTFTLGVWALHAVYVFGCVWANLTEASKIFTIQDPTFWGPVTMLVPTNCTLFHQYEAILNQSSSDDATTSLAAILGEEEDETELEYTYFGVLKLNEKQKAKFITLVQLEDCGTNVSAPNATYGQQYFSATWTASKNFGIHGLHDSRFRFFYLFATVIFIFLFIDLIFACVMTFGVAEDADKASQMIVKLAWTGGMKVLIATLQTIVLSLFVTFDRGDHLIMSYMPGWALILTAMWSTVIGPCAKILADQSALFASVCGCISCGFYAWIGCPMLVWTYCFNVDFLCQAFWYHSLTPIFDPHFPGMMDSLGTLSKTYYCAHFCEVCGPCAEMAGREVEVGEPVYVISEPLLA